MKKLLNKLYKLYDDIFWELAIIEQIIWQPVIDFVDWLQDKGIIKNKKGEK